MAGYDLNDPEQRAQYDYDRMNSNNSGGSGSGGGGSLILALIMLFQLLWRLGIPQAIFMGIYTTAGIGAIIVNIYSKMPGATSAGNSIVFLIAWAISFVLGLIAWRMRKKSYKFLIVLGIISTIGVVISLGIRTHEYNSRPTVFVTATTTARIIDFYTGKSAGTKDYAAGKTLQINNEEEEQDGWIPVYTGEKGTRGWILAEDVRPIQKSKHYHYIVTDAGDGIRITEYTARKARVVIPVEIAGLPVVRIDRFFESHDMRYARKITSVKIPNTVTYIGDNVFAETAKLKKITLPESLKFIGYQAFNGSGITSIVIPEGVTDIGVSVFGYCENLTSVTFPRSLQRMGEYTFSATPSLTTVIIPSGTKIKYGFHSKTKQDNYTYIESVDMYFREGQNNGPSFKGCSRLTETSKQAIKDSGYKGPF